MVERCVVWVGRGVGSDGRGGDGLTVCWRGEEGSGRGQQLVWAGMVCRLPATGAVHMIHPHAVWGNNKREQRGGEGQPSSSMA
jgi:hypothetical protein